MKRGAHHAFALVVLTGLLFFAPRARAANGTLKVLVPDPDNLQYLSFWVAKGAGYFADEGFDIELVIPKSPQETRARFENQDAYVAVLPPPVYLELIAARFPLVLVCNLLKNDPIELIVTGSAWDARHLSRDVPVGERLRAIKGLRLGVAPNPPKRLRALFAAYGLDADKDLEMKIFHGNEQNAALARGDVDALFAHSPYLEKALVDQGARILVNLSAGEAPALATPQIHALVFARRFAEDSPDTAAAMARAIQRAETLIHADRAATVTALMRELPSLDVAHTRAIVDIYEPAVPRTPEVSADGFAASLALFPASRTAPSLDGIDLARYVAPQFASEASRPPTPPRVRWIGAGVVAAFLLVVLALTRRKAARGDVTDTEKSDRVT